MLFFQVVLLAGYSYAHWITSRLSGRGQMFCHLALLAGSLAFLPIAPNVGWKPHGDDMPVGHILLLLAFTIGLPYFLLSTTGPLLQESFRRETGAHALPAVFAVERRLALGAVDVSLRVRAVADLGTQIISCERGVRRVCALLHVVCAAIRPAGARPGGGRGGKRRAARVVRHRSLAGAGGVRIGDAIGHDQSTVPGGLVGPVFMGGSAGAIPVDVHHLLRSRCWYHRSTFMVLLAVGVALAFYAIYEGNGLEMWLQLVIYSGVLFVCCMVCHGELTRSKPAPRYATLFYLMVSAGGALGGILVAIVAPLVLHDFWEYHLGLVSTVVLAFLAVVQEPAKAGWSGDKPLTRLLRHLDRGRRRQSGRGFGAGLDVCRRPRRGRFGADDRNDAKFLWRAARQASRQFPGRERP